MKLVKKEKKEKTKIVKRKMNHKEHDMKMPMEETSEQFKLEIDPSKQQYIGIKTTKALLKDAQKEIKTLGGILKYPPRPFVVVIGGAKVGDKLGIISYLWKRADYFLLGSGPAATFFAAKGLPIGDSLLDKNSIPKIKKFLNSKKIILPLDVKIRDKRILDIGDDTARKYCALIKKSRTVIWNGPVGSFEDKEFSEGTKAVWGAVFANHRAQIVVGGGETLASLSLIRNSMSLIPKNVFLSTGGGAMLEYLSGKKLPGIEALK